MGTHPVVKTSYNQLQDTGRKPSEAIVMLLASWHSVHSSTAQNAGYALSRVMDAHSIKGQGNRGATATS